MGVYYDYYLDKKIDDNHWLQILVDGKACLYYVRSWRELFDEYSIGPRIEFQCLSEEYQEQHREQYEKEKAEGHQLGFSFYEMDLVRMQLDYKNQVHEYAGIISKNSYKRLQSDVEYCPKIIEEEIYAKFKDNIKDNYIYYEWDTIFSEYYYLYQIMPIIENALADNNLKIEDVRLICHIC